MCWLNSWNWLRETLKSLWVSIWVGILPFVATGEIKQTHSVFWYFKKKASSPVGTRHISVWLACICIFKDIAPKPIKVSCQCCIRPSQTSHWKKQDLMQKEGSYSWTQSVGIKPSFVTNNVQGRRIISKITSMAGKFKLDSRNPPWSHQLI